MTIHAGMFGGLPALTCDVCHCRLPINTRGKGGPPAWFVKGKAPKRWRVYLDDDGLRRHRCPDCPRPGFVP